MVAPRCFEKDATEKYFVEMDSLGEKNLPVGARLNLWISLLVWFQKSNCKARQKLRGSFVVILSAGEALSLG